MIEGYIYDDTGANIATIIGGKVFGDRNKPSIATVRDGNIYGNEGALIGHLGTDGLPDASISETLRDLIKG